MNTLTTEKIKIYKALVQMNPEMKLSRMTVEIAKQRFGYSRSNLDRIWRTGQGGETAINEDMQKWIKEGLSKKKILNKARGRYGSTMKSLERILKNSDEKESEEENDSSPRSSSSSDISNQDDDGDSSTSILNDNQDQEQDQEQKEQENQVVVNVVGNNETPTKLLLRSISTEESNAIHESMLELVKDSNEYILNNEEGLDTGGITSDSNFCLSLQELSLETGVPLSTLETVPNL